MAQMEGKKSPVSGDGRFLKCTWKNWWFVFLCIFVYKNNSPLFHGFWKMPGNFQYCDLIATPFVPFSLASSCYFSFMLGGFSRSECRELMGYPALPVREDLQACLCFDMFRPDVCFIAMQKIWIVRPLSSTELVLFRLSLVLDFAIAPLLVING